MCIGLVEGGGGGGQERPQCSKCPLSSEMG